MAGKFWIAIKMCRKREEDSKSDEQIIAKVLSLTYNMTAHTWTVVSSLCTNCDGSASSSPVGWYCCWWRVSVVSQFLLIKLGHQYSYSFPVSNISKNLSSSSFLSSLGVQLSDCPTRLAYPCCVGKLSMFVNVSYFLQSTEIAARAITWKLTRAKARYHSKS